MNEPHRNSFEDIENLIRLGIQRSVPTDKEWVHYGDFSTLINLAGHYGIDANIFLEKVSLEPFYKKSGEILKGLSDSILAKAPEKVILDSSFDYLSEEDPLVPSDFIFVFGSRQLDRARKAAELYKRGIASRIYCAGSHPIEDSARAHEGQTFKNFLVSECGLPENQIIADPNENSMSMVDNVRGFLNYLDNTKTNLNSVTMIITAHNLRRGWAIFNKFTDKVLIRRCSSGYRTDVERGDWFKSAVGIRLIYEEYEKIKAQRITNVS